MTLPPPPATGPDAEEREEQLPWLRLDRRMLLIHPITELVRFVPVLLVSVFAGGSTGNYWFSLVVIAFVVMSALAKWFTTGYRLGPVHVQLRTGLFQKKMLSIPRTRIRSVDLEAGVMHRVLGLTIVRIGTGQRLDNNDARFELNALDTSITPALRDELMTASLVGDRPADRDPDAPPPAPTSDIAGFRWSWVRFAPLSATGVATIAAAGGLLVQSGLGNAVRSSEAVSETVRTAERLGVVVAVGAAAVVLLIAASALACVRYLLVYGNLTVTDSGSTVRIGHGLLRTRQATLDSERLRGVTVHDPLLLRLAHGAALDAVMTGVSAEKGESSLVLPSAPRSDVSRVAARIAANHDVPNPYAARLRRHGAVARQRRYVRALVPVAVLIVALVPIDRVVRPLPFAVWPALAVLIVAAVAVAADRYRNLGHDAGAGWLVTRQGSLDRRCDAIDGDGVVGWTVRQTFFQRRAGVATLVAATAAGRGRYEVMDVPEDVAWGIAETVRPGAGDVWTR